MLKDDISNVFNFHYRLLFACSSNHRCNSGTQISAVTFTLRCRVYLLKIIN